jgi:hypothetical protein
MYTKKKTNEFQGMALFGETIFEKEFHKILTALCHVSDH